MGTVFAERQEEPLQKARRREQRTQCPAQCAKGKQFREKKKSITFSWEGGKKSLIVEVTGPPVAEAKAGARGWREHGGEAGWPGWGGKWPG